jgi:hypothetical protein
MEPQGWAEESIRIFTLLSEECGIKQQTRNTMTGPKEAGEGGKKHLEQQPLVFILPWLRAVPSCHSTCVPLEVPCIVLWLKVETT